MVTVTVDHHFALGKFLLCADKSYKVLDGTSHSTQFYHAVTDGPEYTKIHNLKYHSKVMNLHIIVPVGVFPPNIYCF